MTDEQLEIALVLATSTGGVGANVGSLSRYLIGQGHRVTVCGPAATDELFGYSNSGVTFRPVEISASPSPVRDVVAMLKLRRAIPNPDVVHAHGLRAGFVASGSRRRPLVTTWHNLQLATGSRGKLLSQLEQHLARSVDVAVGVSEDLVERIAGFGAADARFIPVTAAALTDPLKDPAAVRTELGCGDRPLILSVARLHPQKSLEVLIGAASRWTNREPAPFVAIAGDGPQREELADLIERLQAPVTLLGRRSDIADLLSACDVAVLTSQWEARSLFAQEALRAGKPLVATDTGGIPGLVGDGAKLVAPGDADALDTAVRTLLDSPDAAADLAKRSRQRGEQLPTEMECNAAVEALYRELVGRS
jgi:glycosyltransferase involved in cell wall biosynthesis